MNPSVVRLIAILIAIVSALFVLILWMAGGIQSPKGFLEPPRQNSRAVAGTSTDTQTLSVLTWNIAWAYGWGSEGSGTARPKAHFEDSIQKIGEAIKALDVDVVLLQEVDFHATRSHGIDQADRLAEISGLPYIARVVSWKANWVPFPYWPPSEHFGKMESGGAVLSRYPILSNRYEWMQKAEEYGFLYRLFYPFRYWQHVELGVGEDKVSIVNTHLEAFVEANRVSQAMHVQSVLRSFDRPLMVFGGDLNSVPPESTLRGPYPDEPTVHANDDTVPLLRRSKSLKDSVPAATFAADESAYFTFPAHAPNRKLDYLFYGDGFELVNVRVPREVGPVSDHLPLLMTLKRRVQ